MRISVAVRAINAAIDAEPCARKALDSIRSHSVTIVTLTIAAFWVFAGLVGHDPWKPDEAYSFGVVLEYLRHRDWVVPMLAGEPFVEKPPLLFITAAAFASMLGGLLPLHDAARLATGFYMTWSLVFLVFTARELYGRERCWMPVLVMLGCLGLTIRGHQLITDIVLLAGVSTAIYGFALVKRAWIAGAVALGIGASIAFLAKGLLGPGLVAVTAISLWCIRTWRSAKFAQALALATIIAFPSWTVWPIALYVRSPELFHEWLVTNNLGRFLGFVHIGPSNPPLFYLRTLPWWAFPALPLAVWTLWNTRSDRTRAWQDPGLQLPAVAFVAMLGVLMLAHDSREVYMMPLLVPLALLAAARIESLPCDAVRFSSRASIALWGSAAALLWLGWAVLSGGEPAELYAMLVRYQPSLRAQFNWTALIVAGVATAAWYAFSLRPPASTRSVVTDWTAGLSLCWLLTMTLWLPVIDSQKSYRGMFRSMSERLPVAGCISSRHLGEPQRAMIEYYLGIQTIRQELEPDAPCTALLVQGWRSDGPVPLEPEWSLVWEGARSGDGKELYRLYVRRSSVRERIIGKFP